MNTNILLRLAPRSLAVVLVLAIAGCASSDGTPDTAGADDITPQELAAGEAAGPEGDDAPVADGDATNAIDPEDGATITTPAEDSASFLDPGAEAAAEVEPVVPPSVIDPDSLQQTQSCHRVTGYRSGHKMNICVTTIDGKYVEVNTARAYLRMRKAARKAGVTMHVVSGFRSMATQRYLYHCYKTKKCNGGNLAAVPGYSNHQSGHALDLNTSAAHVYSWLANHGHSYGFRRTVPSEKWHWEH
ncbi:MAG: D-alanyl-D-alanine carboxypeptidase [Labilithrix sp.]|nr:D-alanyl-D-alanine carboxypeptidase [Labilithrix sp.]